MSLKKPLRSEGRADPNEALDGAALAYLLCMYVCGSMWVHGAKGQKRDFYFILEK